MDAARYSFLVVEDEPAHARLIMECLQVFDSNVVAVSTHAGALETLEASEFDLIVLDMELPDATGFETQEWLTRRGDTTPVLFVTSDDLAEDVARAMREGAVDYVVKRPNYIQELRRAVQRILDSLEANPKERHKTRERKELLEALTSNEWNISAAARSLGVPRSKLRSRMRALGLD